MQIYDFYLQKKPKRYIYCKRFKNMSITGMTIDEIAKEMYKDTKKQAKQYGKKLPKVKEIYTSRKTSIKDFITEPFEPKKVNRFFLRFPKKIGLPEWLVKSMTRPSYPSNNEISVVLYDPIIKSSTQALLNFIGNQDSLTKKNFKLKLEMLDPLGTVIEKWILKKCFIKTIEWSPLDYGSDDLCYLYLTIGYNDIKINFDNKYKK